MPGPDQPPPNTNPILSAYLSFVQSTPLVTRYIITLASCTYLSSWLVDPTYALTNIPMFTLGKFELYRIVTSTLLCPTLLNLIFAYLSFVESGKRLEYAMGSGAFVYLLVLLGLLTNLLYLLGSVLLYGLTSNPLYLMGSCGGVWIWILSLLASECSRAPAASYRKLFVINVPTLYFPLAILLLFSLLSGAVSIPYCLAVAAGYAYGYGYLSRFQVSPERITKWETNQGCLSNFAKRDGWIYTTDSQGIGAWSTSTNSDGLQQQQQQQQQQQNEWAPTTFFRGRRSNTSNTSSSSAASHETIPLTGSNQPQSGWKGKGQPLGSQHHRITSSTTTATHTEEQTRAARLEALERRRITTTHTEDDAAADRV